MVGALMCTVAICGYDICHYCSYIVHVPGTTLERSKGPKVGFWYNAVAGLKDPESEMQFFQTAKESNTST